MLAFGADRRARADHADPRRYLSDINPITASLIGAALLHEPLSWNLMTGIVMVFIGIWIATTAGHLSKTTGKN